MFIKHGDDSTTKILSVVDTDELTDEQKREIEKRAAKIKEKTKKENKIS
jgi:hypothetical protein